MASSSDGIPVLPPMPDFSVHNNSPFSSAGDLKFHLQTLLDGKEKQLQQAGTLGQRVLAQQMELEERIRQLQEIEADKSEDDEIDEQARIRYRELADTLISWDNENAQLSSAFGNSKVQCCIISIQMHPNQHNIAAFGKWQSPVPLSSLCRVTTRRTRTIEELCRHLSCPV